MLSRKLVVGSFLLLCGSSYSLPINPMIHEGAVEVWYDNQLAEINSGAFAEIHWDDFSMGADETVRFIQKDQTSVALNRVLSLNPSNLFGRLESNGQIILINPNGVLVGKNAILDTGSFIASTLDLIGNFQFAGDSKASVVNEGTILGREGDVVLLSQRVENHGKIEANGSALLGAAKEIYYLPNSKEKLFIRLSEDAVYEGCGIENSGTILALRAELKADGNLYSYAINHSGGIDALETEEIGGEIFLVAEKGLVQVSGSLLAPDGEIRVLAQRVSLVEDANIEASEGKILIGGDFRGQNPDVINSEYTYVGQDVTIRADAKDRGDGGRVIVWGSDVNATYGTISAKGGSLGGDGGFVEISSPKSLLAKGPVDTSAPFGKAGTLLLDPCVVTLSTGGTTVGVTTVPPPITYDFDGLAAANIDVADIIAFLAANDVVINATATGGAGSGSITLLGNGAMGDISWASGTKLTLIADTFIAIENRIVSTSMAVPATTVVVELSAPVVDIGNLTVASTSQSQISIASGQVKVTSPTSFSVYPSTLAANGINAGTMPAVPGTVDVNTGTLLLQGTSTVASSPALIVAFSDIDVHATGNITITGGTSAPGMDAEAQIYTRNAGDITVIGDQGMYITGGSGTGSSSAVITARVGGDILVDLAGVLSIQGGTTAGGDGAAAIAFQDESGMGGVGSVTVSAQDITMVSGTGAGGGNIAVIGVINAASGPTIVTTDPNFGIFLQSQASNFAFIGSPSFAGGSGAVTVNTGILNVIASSDAGSAGGFAAVTGSGGDLIVNASTEIAIFGGGGAGSMGNFAGIILNSAHSLTVTSDHAVLFGGASPGCFAVIESQMGPASVSVVTDFILQAGFDTGTYAGIGAATVGGTGNLILSGGHLDMIGGSAAGAYAGVYTGDPTLMAGGDGNLFVDINGDINMLGGLSPSAQALIGTFGTVGTNALSIETTGPISLTSFLSEAIISTLGGAIDIHAGDNITLISMPGVESTISVGALGTSDLILISGKSINIGSTIQNLGSGDLYIVVDADFPRPFFGPGVFSLAPTGIITTASGAIRIFTSQQNLELNAILGTINGLNFVPGAIFVDTNQEVWCTYYPSTIGGFPFTIFYKDCLQLLAQQAEIIVAEMLTSLHAFNEFPGWWQRFTISVDLPNGDRVFNSPYFLRRRYSPSFLQPKSYTVDLHDIL